MQPAPVQFDRVSFNQGLENPAICSHLGSEQQDCVCWRRPSQALCTRYRPAEIESYHYLGGGLPPLLSPTIRTVCGTTRSCRDLRKRVQCTHTYLSMRCPDVCAKSVHTHFHIHVAQNGTNFEMHKQTEHTQTNRHTSTNA